MIRSIAVIVVLAASCLSFLSIPVPAAAQTTAVECAGTLWLESLAATPEAGDAAAPNDGEAPAWLTAELTDACSGETFALSGFAGKTLLVETMATWCGECHAQLTRLAEAAAQIPDEQRQDIVLVALSLETDLPREDLAGYAAANEFPFVFAVLPAETLKALVEDFGQVVAVPPATPHLIVAPDGTIGELRTGSTSPQELLALFTEAREARAS